MHALSIPVALSLRLLMAALLLAVGGQSLRAELVETDSVRIAVSDRSAAALAAARSEGLKQVLTKMSGTLDSLSHPVIKESLGEPQRYLAQYSYEESLDEQTLVRLEYDDAALRELLRRAAQPLWTANRPLVLGWLVYSDGQRRGFATGESQEGLRAAMRAAFERRGVPLQQPLYDLTDVAQLSPGAAWRQSSSALIAASGRYGDAELLAGRVAQLSDGSWLGDWRFLDAGRWVSRPVKSSSVSDFVDAGADLVATALASRYAVMDDSGGDLRYSVSIEGLDTYAAFVDASTAISSLEAVQRVVPETLSRGRVLLRLESSADLAQLARIIELDSRFVRQRIQADEGALLYSWEN